MFYEQGDFAAPLSKPSPWGEGGWPSGQTDEGAVIKFVACCGGFRRCGGEVLSQRWERTQRITGDAGDGHFVPIGPLTPDPVFTRVPIR